MNPDTVRNGRRDYTKARDDLRPGAIAGAWREQRCRSCDTWLPLDSMHFHQAPNTLTGFNRQCRWCYVGRKLGVGREDWWRLYEKQRGCCAICFRSSDERKLVLDHDHVTNRVRGLLCGHCNQGLGQFGDSAAVLRCATLYLEHA